jgi:hypothetical protein
MTSREEWPIRTDEWSIIKSNIYIVKYYKKELYSGGFRESTVADASSPILALKYQRRSFFSPFPSQWEKNLYLKLQMKQIVQKSPSTNAN